MLSNKNEALYLCGYCPLAIVVQSIHQTVVCIQHVPHIICQIESLLVAQKSEGLSPTTAAKRTTRLLTVQRSAIFACIYTIHGLWHSGGE